MEEYHRQAELQKKIEDMTLKMQQKENEYSICMNLAARECEEAHLHMTKVNYSIRQYAALLNDFCLLQEDLLSSENFASTITRLIIGDKSAALMKHFDKKHKSNAIDWAYILLSPNDEGDNERKQILNYLSKRQKDGLLNMRKLLKHKNREKETSIEQLKTEGENSYNELEANFKQKLASIEETLHKSEEKNTMLMDCIKDLAIEMDSLKEKINTLETHVIGLEHEVEDSNEQILHLKHTGKLKDASIMKVNEEMHKVM